MKSFFKFLGIVAAVVASIVACQTQQPVAQTGGYIELIDSLRKEKDKEFAVGKNSPFADLYEDFKGLNYFSVSEKWNVPVSWIQLDTTYIREFSDSKGGTRRYRFEGIFEFNIEQQNFRLPVWSEDQNPKWLFVMFKDQSNGSRTYSGGRYIEMPKPNSEQPITLDFNTAFNPYCHYNKNYSCPVIPADHMLKVEILAGEKLYKP
jgi:uncharacterized protein (DUF1684 family)